MQTNIVRPINFKVDKDLYLVVDKADLIGELYDQFKVKLSDSDIKVVDDGTRLQFTFGTHNQNIPTSTFAKIADSFTTDGIEHVTYDDQVLKLWLRPSPDYLFAYSGDDRLTFATPDTDAPGGTIQINLGEHRYTLMYAREERISEAIKNSLQLIGQIISSKHMEKDGKFVAQINDHRISILRKKFGAPGRIYNDRVRFKDSLVDKIVVYA